MAVFFETKTSVFTDDAQHCGDIEEQDGVGWTFTAAVEMPLSADELRAIADKLDTLNQKYTESVQSGAKDKI